MVNIKSEAMVSLTARTWRRYPTKPDPEGAGEERQRREHHGRWRPNRAPRRLSVGRPRRAAKPPITGAPPPMITSPELAGSATQSAVKIKGRGADQRVLPENAVPKPRHSEPKVTGDLPRRGGTARTASGGGGEAPIGTITASTAAERGEARRASTCIGGDGAWATTSGDASDAPAVPRRANGGAYGAGGRSADALPDLDASRRHRPSRSPSTR